MFPFHKKRTISIAILSVWVGLFCLQTAPTFAIVPIAGFQPIVGITLSKEHDDENTLGAGTSFFISREAAPLTGNLFGPTGGGYHALALLDTGAGATLLTAATDAAFDIQGQGFRGIHTQALGGATGSFDAVINNPLSLYATGTSSRTGEGASYGMANSSYQGQTNQALLTLPTSSELPNVLGLTYSSRYATMIRNDQPQIFKHQGRTVRTPEVSFGELGSGANAGISRRIPITLSPSSAFTTPPLYVYDFTNITNGTPWTENPTAPTHLTGGLFIDVQIKNAGNDLGTKSFFFDTGADITVVSEINAVKLGFDPTLDEPDFKLSVVGSGGTLNEVPGFFAKEFRIPAIGGSLVAYNVPILVLDVTDVGNPGNVVDGIVGMNVFAGRNLVIDSKPSLGGGGAGPSLYVSDKVTIDHSWTTTATTAAWSAPGSWNTASAPAKLWAVTMNNSTGGNQQAVISADSTIFDLNATGSSNGVIDIKIEAGAELVVFSGVNLNAQSQLTLAGGRLDAQYIEIQGGTLAGSGIIEVGNGQIKGQVENRRGIIAPGNDSFGNSGVGELSIIGLLANGEDGILQFEIGGTTAGTEFDHLTVDGNVALDGALEISMVDLGAGVFTPQKGDSFELITSTGLLSGTFDEVQITGTSLDWALHYNASNLALEIIGLTGDYNQDNKVDDMDFILWKNNFGSTTNLAADGNNNGTVDAADFTIWRDHLGNMLGSGSSIESTPVPEPSTLLLMLLGVTMLFNFHQKR